MNTARICQVHDADDPIPGRTCGRPMPCSEHTAVPCEGCNGYHGAPTIFAALVAKNNCLTAEVHRLRAAERDRLRREGL